MDMSMDAGNRIADPKNLHTELPDDEMKSVSINGFRELTPWHTADED